MLFARFLLFALSCAALPASLERHSEYPPQAVSDPAPASLLGLLARPFLKLLGDTLPSGVETRPLFMRFTASCLRLLGFLGDLAYFKTPEKLDKPSYRHWMNESGTPHQLSPPGSPLPFNITTKDGVSLESIHVRVDGANTTVVLWGGMLGGREGQTRMSVFLQSMAKVSTLLVSRRGQSRSLGSNVKSGELGVYYDVQASMTYLEDQGVDLSSVIVYGYCLGSLYAVMTVNLLDLIYLYDRPFIGSRSRV